jgi:hypothetical protein
VWGAIIVTLLPWPCAPVVLFLRVAKLVRMLSYHPSRRPWSISVLINVEAVAPLGYVQERRSQIAFIVLSKAFPASTMASLYSCFR